MGYFDRFKRSDNDKDKYYYLVTWVEKDDKLRMVVLSLKNAHNEVEANQIAYDKMKGRIFHIHPSESSQLSEATREAKAKYFMETGNLEQSIERASHQDVDIIE